MTKKQYYLTSEGAERLRDELDHLKGPVREQLAERLRSAIEMGDLSENAEYISAKEEQAFIEGRIQELEHLLKYATLIEDRHNPDEVDLGTKVTIKEDEYPPETYFLVGSKEADPRNGRISHESPIGQALIGKRVGDEVEVNTPNGSLRLQILNIE
ncbi:MAG: transcription elongation factor GreA [Anaerolineales bacterium]|jgi:transcription elongation factor GreA